MSRLPSMLARDGALQGLLTEQLGSVKNQAGTPKQRAPGSVQRLQGLLGTRNVAKIKHCA